MKMENRCISCGAIIPEGQQVCPRCLGGGSMMKNGSGYPVPVEQEAIHNIERENQRNIQKLFHYIKGILDFLGFEMEALVIKDKHSLQRYKYKKP